MSPKNKIIAGVALILLIVGGIGISAWIERHHQKQEAQHQIKADEAKGKADAHAEQAGQTDAQGAKQAEVVKATVAENDRLRRELAKLRAGLPVVPPAAPVADCIPMGPGPVADARDAVIEKQDQLIASQDKTIQGQALELSLAYASRDQYRAAFASERTRSIELGLALEAQKRAASAGQFKASLKWGSIGFGSGFAAGFLTRR